MCSFSGGEAWPSFDSPEEAHGALCIAIAVPERALDAERELPNVRALVESGRAYRFVSDAPSVGAGSGSSTDTELLALWVAAEHAALARAALPVASIEPALAHCGRCCGASRR